MAEAVYFYRDPAYVFVAAVLGGLVASRLRQALIPSSLVTSSLAF